MKITHGKTKYHRFCFYYDYNPEVVDFCRSLKDAFSWEAFNFEGALKCWVFSNVHIVAAIKQKFPDVLIDTNVRQVVSDELKFELVAQNQREVVEEIKAKTETDFIVNGVKGELYPYQKIGVEFLTASKGRAILADSPGVGKEQSIFSKVLTPNGWVTLGNIKVGDCVIGKNGYPTMVTGVFPQGIKKLYRIKLRDGSSTLAGLDHLWAVKDKNRIRRNMDWDILTTKELLNRSLKNKQQKNNYMIPFASPVKNNDKIFPIKPYTLGALIGDGSLTQTSVYITLSPKKEHVLEKIKTEYPEYAFPSRSGSGCSAYAFTNGRRGTTPNKMTHLLMDLNLRVHSPKRFIPVQYKHGSIQQRFDLLRGLMDTDGSAYKNRVRYHTGSKQLAFDVAEIVRSLGGEAMINSYDREDKTYGTEYSVNIKLPKENPFSEESYKALQWKPAGNRKWYGRMIESIQYEKEEEAICISVDAQDHLYVTEDYIVTHNTAQTLAFISHEALKRSLVISPASVKFAWANEVKKWTKLSSVIIDSKTKLHEIPADINIWIINYDQLKKHLPQLLKVHFDVVVGDECVIPQTYIATIDGQKQVTDLVPGELLLTYNLKDKVYEYKPLVAIVKKPLNKKIIKIGELVCTDDHPIFDGEDFVAAKDAKKTFPIGFPEIKEGTSDEILAGCLMGDGSLQKNKGVTKARLKIGNCLKNEDYIEMKCRIIKELGEDRLKKVWNGGYKPSLFFRAVSLTSEKLTLLYDKTYKEKERVVNKDLLNMLGEAGLAVWLQDDGSVYRGCISLCTHRYKEKGNIIIQKWFNEMGFSPTIRKERKMDGKVFFFLGFGVQDSLRIYKAIRDYILPSMRYKFVSLEERFNKIHTNVCIVCEQRMFGLHKGRQNQVGRQKVCIPCRKKYGTQVYSNKQKNSRKIAYDCVYDLQLEGNHNFFADGILVHNCHMIKSITAQRTKAFRLIARNAEKVILLSGTPLLSRPVELFSLLNIVDPKTWSNYYDYVRRYCGATQTRFGLDVSGASNTAELHSKINGYFLRRTKDQVLKELPPKIYIDIPIELTGEISKKYNAAESGFASYMKQYSGKKDADIAKTLQAEKLAQMNTLRMIIAEGVLTAVSDLIEDIIEAGEKVIVFSSFVGPLKELQKKHQKNSVMIIGETKAEDRGEIVRRFQEDPSCNVFFGGILSAGTGITLTAASNTIFIDLPWNISDLIQAESRNHRPSQEASSVNIYKFPVMGTIYEDIVEMLDQKQQIFNEVIDGKKSENGNILNSISERLIKKYK